MSVDGKIAGGMGKPLGCALVVFGGLFAMLVIAGWRVDPPTSASAAVSAKRSPTQNVSAGPPRVAAVPRAADTSAAAPIPNPPATASAQAPAVAAEESRSAIPAAPSASIGEPIAQLQKELAPLGVEFESSPLLDGRPRMFGASADSKTQIGLIGHGGVLEQAELTFATGPDVATRNALAITKILGATGWSQGGGDWVLGAVNAGGGKTTHGRVQYEVTTVVPGLYVLVAKAIPK